jgi:hypothetical protein
MAESPGGPGQPDWGEIKGKLTGARGPDRIILVAGLLFFVAMFLPWFGVSLGPIGATTNGWHGFTGYVAGLCGLAIAAFASVRLIGVKVDLGTIQDGIVYLGLGAGTLVFAVLRFVLKPGGYGIVKVGWRWGAFVGLALAVATFYGAWQKYQAKA